MPTFVRLKLFKIFAPCDITRLIVHKYKSSYFRPFYVSDLKKATKKSNSSFKHGVYIDAQNWRIALERTIFCPLGYVRASHICEDQVHL
jgi:hypothetical protein